MEKKYFVHSVFQKYLFFRQQKKQMYKHCIEGSEKSTASAMTFVMGIVWLTGVLSKKHYMVHGKQ